MVVPSPRASGSATATVGTAWFSVHVLNRASAIRRVVMPITTTAPATTAATTAVKRRPLRVKTRCTGTDASACGTVSGDMRFSDRWGELLAFPFMHHAEDNRHEHPRGHG